MAKKLPELSIFFPFWNEEKNITNVVEAAVPIAEQVADTWEILLVDDGSTDKTPKIAQQLAEKYSNIRVVTIHPNRGYGAALRTGLTESKYDYIVFIDGDGQFDFSQVSLLIDEIDSADIVIGYRKKRRDQKILIRLLLMYMLKAWAFLLFRFYVKDIDCGFKMFKKSTIEKISPLRSEGAMITTEILAKVKVKKLKLKQVGVTHYPRQYGEQSGANLQVVIRALFESLILWWDIHNARF
jgi:glycosyltransferase involved in cell wall biosynthesis